MALYERTQAEQADEATRRRQIEARLERIRELYGWGDMERDAYQRERESLTAELATLTEPVDQRAVLERTAALLNNVSSAWEVATQVERNQLARLLFEAVEVKDNRVAAVTPQPDFAPFFLLDWQQRQESSKERK